MAEYAVIITPEDVQNASTYVPVAEKKLVSQGIAFFCSEAVAPEQAESEKGIPSLPWMVQEDRKLRQQFQMGILADYLGREYPEEVVILPTPDGGTVEQALHHCMAEDEYDRWAGSHVMNQLERMKKANRDVCDKVFDLLYDYKNYENMISVALRDHMDQVNNGMNRAVEYLSKFATEEAAQAVMQSLMQSKEDVKEALDEVEEYKKKKGEADG